MDAKHETWVVVLAAGDGTRLESVTRTREGLVIPKQFCAFGGVRTLLGATLDRSRGLAPAERTLVVVAEKHRPFWAKDLASQAARNVIVQPSNRGTAAGLLLPLLHLQGRDPSARVVILPSDHHVEREDVFRAACLRAQEACDTDPGRVVLLGITPDEPEPQYGWILPEAGDAPGPHDVLAFVEKPERTRALHLMQAGALWSSFVLVGRVDALVGLYEAAAPGLLQAFRETPEALEVAPGAPAEALCHLYELLPAVDFSREVLEATRARLRVLAVPPCGWSDLGTPARVARWLSRRDGVALAARAWAAGGVPRPITPTGRAATADAS